jgi:hypothetical protein
MSRHSRPVGAGGAHVAPDLGQEDVWCQPTRRRAAYGPRSEMATLRSGDHPIHDEAVLLPVIKNENWPARSDAVRSYLTFCQTRLTVPIRPSLGLGPGRVVRMTLSPSRRTSRI